MSLFFFLFQTFISSIKQTEVLSFIIGGDSMEE